MVASRAKKDVSTQIRITDPVVIRRVVEDQHREGDKTATKAACRIINSYLAQQAFASKTAMVPEPKVSDATQST